MSYEQGNRDRYYGDREYAHRDRDGFDESDSDDPSRSGHDAGRRFHDEIYSKRVPAGKRTYFFDVKTTRSGEDFFVTITESKRIDEGHYEKHKIFLYKEDFGKFISAMHEVITHIKDQCLPDYDFRNLPDLPIPAPDPDVEESYSDDRDY